MLRSSPHSAAAFAFRMWALACVRIGDGRKLFVKNRDKPQEIRVNGLSDGGPILGVNRGEIIRNARVLVHFTWVRAVTSYETHAARTPVSTLLAAAFNRGRTTGTLYVPE